MRTCHTHHLWVGECLRNRGTFLAECLPDNSLKVN